MTGAAQPTPGPDRACHGCGIPVVPQSWRQAPPGTRLYSARGLCAVCYARAYARRELPPGRWLSTGRSTDFDEVAVERLIDGTLMRTPTSSELAAAIDCLDRRGYSARRIAERLGCTMRTVQRRRAVRRAQPLEVAS